MRTLRRAVLVIVLCLASRALAAPAPATQPTYHFYFGNTHAHTAFTWSHGEQWINPNKNGGGAADAEPTGKKTPLIYVDKDGAQFPAKEMKLKPDWQKVQGPPAAHYALAKSKGYDFYVCTDHSQEADFQPPSPTNKNWLATKEQAAAATDDTFVALAGYEHSENNGPDGKGHLNVINSDEYLNAMAKGIDLHYLYNWLKTAKPNGDGPVVASFNHPGPHQYADWAFRDDQVTDIITMLEVINSNNKIHYEGFINALDHGWKVSPCCGNDNHGLTGIPKHTSRTVVLATAKTKAAILDAMKHRRTYATLDKNLQCSYTVNGSIMGSTLDKPDTLKFDITITDPDTDKPADQITKLDIVKDHGEVAETYTPSPAAHTVTWQPTLHDTTSKYFFVRVYTAGGGDAPKPNPNKPVAWLAPVWTGR
jgi:hypothetical protein